MESPQKELENLIDFETLKYCFECGICTASCPIAEIMPKHYNPRILLHNLTLSEEKILKSPGFWLCAWCYRCYRRCPQNLKPPEIFQVIKKFAAEHNNLEGFKEALEIIRENIPLPTSSMFVCFHPERSINNEQIILSLEQQVFNPKTKREKSHKAKSAEKKVAVIGSGPAGLAAAQDLVKKGYDVTIFEAQKKPGGMLRRCIPEYRLPKNVLDAEIECIKDLGVEIKTNTIIGKDIKIEDLSKSFKAIFIATGAHNEQKLRIEGEELEGVINSLNFLEKANLKEKIELGDKVVIIGGGDVAIDSARTALKLGAKKVSILYRRTKQEMPANPWEIKEAEDEGVEFLFLVSPKTFLSERGRVSAIQCIKNELAEPDETGRRRPIPVKGSEFTIEANSVVVAIGQTPNLIYLPKEVEITKESTVITNPITLETSLVSFYAGGDAALGPATVMEAIINGKQAATSIDNYLKGKFRKTS